ncbi:hypothetical protein R8Z50_30160 [Longispora sp. K20-0274]|uniref:hypothetical protein n=1 Tax=Longispora sp. K20-0274 TaxID=3088255 RepID=UPI00399BF8CE
MAITPDPQVVARYRARMAGQAFEYAAGMTQRRLTQVVQHLSRIHTFACAGPTAACQQCSALVEGLSMIAAFDIETPDRPTW